MGYLHHRHRCLSGSLLPGRWRVYPSNYCVVDNTHTLSHPQTVSGAMTPDLYVVCCLLSVVCCLKVPTIMCSRRTCSIFQLILTPASRTSNRVSPLPRGLGLCHRVCHHAHPLIIIIVITVFDTQTFVNDPLLLLFCAYSFVLIPPRV